jgi:hypothetical protein
LGESKLCVVAGGQGYIVNVQAPSEYEIVRPNPIMQVLPIVERRMLVFVGYTDLRAYAPLGLVWQTGRISWDGITVAAVTQEHIMGTVWDPPTGRDIDFMVDLDTGKLTGGGTELESFRHHSDPENVL